MRKIIISLILISTLFIVSCSSTNIDIGVGSVNHNNSLQEAHNNCLDKCKIQFPIQKVYPKLTECTDNECYCIC